MRQESRVSTLTQTPGGDSRFISFRGVHSPGYLCERITLRLDAFLLFQDERNRQCRPYQYGRCNTISDYMINEQIRDREVRLVGEDGEQLGIMSAADALRMAQERDLDLVKIAPRAKPPVCKIIDYGKYRYEQVRKQKEARKKQKIVELKEVRLSPNIDVNDMNTKVTAARKFLEKGNKVKATLRFRGREMAHMQASRHILEDFAGKVEDLAVIDKAIKQEGRTLTCVLSPKKN